MRITDEWFDGDMPNPLHPIGWLIDPVRREVTVPVYIDGRVSAVLSDVVLRVGDELGALGDVTRAEEEPSVMEAWRDQ